MIRGSRRCAIVIPLYRADLSECELKVLRRCFDQLSTYCKFFIVPLSAKEAINDKIISIGLNSTDYKVLAIEDMWLTSIDAYNELMLQAWFYRLFDDWEYILIHQLDAMIIDGSRLESLLQINYSYIGGCFVTPFRIPLTNITKWRIYGGNGGLSLRRIQDFVRLLTSNDFKKKPIRSFWDSLTYLLMRGRIDNRGKPLSAVRLALIIFKSLLMSVGYMNTLSTMDKTRTCQEDYLFSVYAPKYFGWFCVPSPAISSQFLIDTYPEVIFSKYRPKDLLGCHGWGKNNLDFWEQSYPDIFSNPV